MFLCGGLGTAGENPQYFCCVFTRVVPSMRFRAWERHGISLIHAKFCSGGNQNEFVFVWLSRQR